MMSTKRLKIATYKNVRSVFKHELTINAVILLGLTGFFHLLRFDSGSFTCHFAEPSSSTMVQWHLTGEQRVNIHTLVGWHMLGQHQ